MRMHAFAAGAAAAAVLAVAGCGTDERVARVTVTVHTGVTTPTVPTTDTTYTTPTTPTTTDDGGTPLELRLPPSGVIDGMGSGEVKRMATARQMVTALFAAGDPGIVAATARLNAAGYQDGYFRDQSGTASGAPTLVRTYNMRLRSDAAANAEVVQATDEVVRSSTASVQRVETNANYSRALSVKLPNGETLLFVTWAAGRDVYGMQVRGKNVHKSDVLEAVTQNHLAWS